MTSSARWYQTRSQQAGMSVVSDKMTFIKPTRHRHLKPRRCRGAARGARLGAGGRPRLRARRRRHRRDRRGETGVVLVVAADRHLAAHRVDEQALDRHELAEAQDADAVARHSALSRIDRDGIAVGARRRFWVARAVSLAGATLCGRLPARRPGTECRAKPKRPCRGKPPPRGPCRAPERAWARSDDSRPCRAPGRRCPNR